MRRPHLPPRKVQLTNIAPHPEIVKFRELIEERLERSDSPLTELPDEYRPLIAKLAHERYAVVSDFLHIPS